MASITYEAVTPSLQPPSPRICLPLDIIFSEILPKLPAKSLLRFKSVSKSFNSLISSHEFTCLHHCQSMSSSSNRLLVVAGSNRSLYCYDLDSLPSTPINTLVWDEGFMSIIGSCNGILLINLSYSTLFPLVLLNPSTRTYIPVLSSTRDSIDGIIGFGFDHLTDDYKIVLVTENDYTKVTSVYSVKSKSWKVVDKTINSDFIEEGCFGILVSNVLHWMFWIPEETRHRIGCFDICSETWKDDVRFPCHYYDPTPDNCFLDLGVLDGCLFCSFENKADLRTDVWVMKDYGVQESWTRLFGVTYFTSWLGGAVPIAYRGGGSSEVLLRQRGKAKHVWYKRADNAINMDQVQQFWYGQAYVLNGSLVSFPCNGSLISLPCAKRFGGFFEFNEITD